MTQLSKHFSWHPKGKPALPISEMHDSHLANAIAQLERRLANRELLAATPVETRAAWRNRLWLLTEEQCSRLEAIARASRFAAAQSADFVMDESLVA